MRFKEFKQPLNESSYDPAVEKLQIELLAKGADLGPFGPKGDGIDGLLGPYTRAAAQKFPEISKNYKDVLAKPDAPSAPRLAPSGPLVGKQQSGKYYVHPKEIAEYLQSKGLDANSIAGLLANAKAESGFNAGVYVANDVNGPGGGLFGFHDTFDGRVHNFTDMVNACGGEDKWQANWKGQLDYALQASGYPKQGFKSPADAAEWFVRNYERPAKVDYQAAIRSRDASQYA
jgi:Phage tail lysozyme